MHKLTYLDLLPATSDFCEELSTIRLLTDEVEVARSLLARSSLRRIAPWPMAAGPGGALIATTAADELGCARYRSWRFAEWDELRLRTADHIVGALDRSPS